ncbi:MAG: hypothetical protein ACKOC5_05920 [Chloroflexota bacterium]
MRPARWLLILLIILLMILPVITACAGGGGGDGSQTGGILPDDVTATYGAELFHQQLTAVWASQVTPGAP